MRIENQMYLNIQALSTLPEEIRMDKQTQAMSQFVPFLATTGIQFDVLSRECVTVSIQNETKVQNHIKGIHACVMATLAETATGFVMSLNIPDNKLPLLKSMQVDYNRVAKGNMQATAHLTNEQVALMCDEERGHFVIECHVSDEKPDDEPPVVVTMTWAWVPKRV